MLPQLDGHVLVAFGDERAVEALGALGELAEGRLEDVALLELLDLLLVDLLVGEGRGEQAGEQDHALPPADAGVQPTQRHADVAIDEDERQALLLGARHRGSHLGAGLDAELVGQALLERPEREVHGQHARPAGAQHLHQVGLGVGVGVGDSGQATGVELDGDAVVVAAGDHLRYGLRRGARDVRRAKQGDAHAVDDQLNGRLLDDRRLRRWLQDARLPSGGLLDGLRLEVLGLRRGHAGSVTLQSRHEPFGTALPS